VKDIYELRVAEGERFVAVVGDLNDTPDSEPLAPLLAGTGLADAFTHPAFDDGGFPGTFGLSNPSDKIDYLLLSPALFALVQAGSVFRRGMWPGTRPRRWETYPELTRPEEAASDHAAIWVDLDL
jgi:endonuclease/exonuclease/phosphatase family metal-dependent hydrolase